jgi:hypothetical protein
MKVSFVRLILIQLVLCAASLGFAADNFTTPMILSGDWQNSDHCRLVTVNTFTEIQGKVFFQQGVGWVIQSESGYKILTPSHVVAGAQIITATCLGKNVLLSLQSRTETKDLALLTPQSDIGAWAMPLIALEDRQTVLGRIDKSQRESIALSNPDHFSEPLEKKLLGQIYNNYLVPTPNGVGSFKTYERDTKIHGIAHFENKVNSLVAETLAIRPGFSGSPLFAQIPADKLEDKNFLINMISPDTYFQPYLMGMLTKAEVNGSRSFGTSLPEILQILPLLMSGSDPSRDVYVEAKGLSSRLRYKMSFDGKNLVRTQELVTNAGGTPKVYSEVCQDATVESSDWDTDSTKTSKLIDVIHGLKQSHAGPTQDPVIEIHLPKDFKSSSPQRPAPPKGMLEKIGGGDYGEGGGGGILKNSVLMAPPNNGQIIMGGRLTSYKKIRSCGKAFIRDQAGSAIDSLMINSQSRKATNLAEAFDLLTRPSNGTACATYYLDVGDSESTTYEVNGVPSIYARNDGTALTAGKDLANSLTCIPGKNIYFLKLKTRNLFLDMTLGQSPQAARGTVTAGTCTVGLTAKNYNWVNRWKHQLRSDKMDLDIALGDEGRILSVKILKLAPECGFSEEALWMYELNFLDREQILRAFSPFSLLRFSVTKGGS